MAELELGRVPLAGAHGLAEHGAGLSLNGTSLKIENEDAYGLTFDVTSYSLLILQIRSLIVKIKSNFAFTLSTPKDIKAFNQRSRVRNLLRH